MEEHLALKCVKKVKLVKTTCSETMPAQNAKLGFAERFATFNELMMAVPDDPKLNTDNNDSYNNDKTLLKLTKSLRNFH